MTPDFDKIQAGMVNGLNKTTNVSKKKEVQATGDSSARTIGQQDFQDNVAGRSSIKADTFDANLQKFLKDPSFAMMRNNLIDKLVEQGYSLEEASYIVLTEMGY